MRPVVFNLFFYGYTFWIALRIWTLAGLGRPKERLWPLIRHWGETVLRAVDVILRSRVEVRGLDRLPGEGPVFMVSKHQSELDIVLLAALFPNAGAVAMQELERYPFFGRILHALDLVLVAVDQGPQGRTEQTVEGARRIITQGRPMVIYPEGTLMELGAKERYRRGAAHIYRALDCHAVPVALSLGVIWPRRDWRKRTGVQGVIEFLEPVPPGLDPETFMAEIERRIEIRTIELIRESAPPEVLARAEDRFARGANNHG
ncbi:1-acyl-sn-glycerol-3-phosphate acyltransferase [Limibaculum sp. FT325]|uniref:lysophospholipid acyltransferase family protein n=1 Tax=Thermohalobaculum sediminis TaxID=2939436 RepID=UPI0020BFFA36|nr:lysophospholipid acyltransferase family protein [Limibaculum sediminis]MCL5777747.1 1-acyl-sn-glycerol-3-phosphate acyltransferase [Limibaculum sediminis]